jgi:hypothetical protein
LQNFVAQTPKTIVISVGSPLQNKETKKVNVFLKYSTFELNSEDLPMFIHLCISALCILLVLPCLANDLVLIKDGKPMASIVIADQPTASAERAARELQTILKKISGALLPILKESALTNRSTTIICVGHSKFVQDQDIPSGDDPFHTREGFILRTHKNLVIAAGNEGPLYRGTEYAVYELLEQLGCRWFFPGPFGEVIPAMKTITLPPLDLHETPSFPVRNIWMSGWADSTSNYDPWLIRNKGTERSMFAFPGDGSIHRLAPPGTYAAQHPEIYAMRPNGERQSDKTPLHEVMLCTSSRLAVEIAASNLVAYFKAHPETDSFGFSAPDGSPRCYCPSCLAANHGFRLENGIDECISDAYFNFVNNIACAVRKECPSKFMIVLAYANRVRPPEGLDAPWSPNILVQIAQLRTSTFRPLGATNDFFALRRGWTIDAWQKLCPHFLIYDYDPHADLSRMPSWRGSVLAQDFKRYHDLGGLGFTTEGQPAFLRTGLNYYFRTKLMWNINADLDALRRDFCEKFFGPAAGPMEEFLRTIETAQETTPDSMAWTPLYADWSSIFPPACMEKLNPLIETATPLAQASPPAQAHVAAFKLMVDYMKAYQSAFSALRENDFSTGLQSADSLQKTVAAVSALQKDLYPPDPGWVLADRQGFQYLMDRLTEVKERTVGPLGNLLGQSPMPVEFKTDPHNDGLFAQWYRADVARNLKWDSIDLHRDWSLNGYRDALAYPFDGSGWYRIQIKAAKPSKGSRVFLFVPEIFAEKAWIWANGQLVFSPPDVALNTPTNPTGRVWAVHRRGAGTLSIELTRGFQPGRDNEFIFLLNGTLDRAQHRGLVGRPFLWSAP